MEVNILSLIRNSGTEIVLAAAISCFVTLAYTASHKLSTKKFFIISFVTGSLCCFAISLLLADFQVSALTLKNAVSGGTLSVTVNAFVKRFAFLDGDDIKSSLEKLLSSIILSDKLDEVVDEIISKLTKSEKEITGEELRSILKANTAIDDDEKLNTVCEIILKALYDSNKT